MIRYAGTCDRCKTEHTLTVRIPESPGPSLVPPAAVSGGCRCSDPARYVELRQEEGR